MAFQLVCSLHLFLVVSMLCEVRAIPRVDRETEDVMDTAELNRDIAIERLKRHILDRLGMDTPPKVGGPLPPLPVDFNVVEENYGTKDGVHEERDDNNHTYEVGKILINGNDITDKCNMQEGAGCYSFKISDDVNEPARVQKIELLVYRQLDTYEPFQQKQTLTVSELEETVQDGSPMLRIGNIITRQETQIIDGWMRVHLNSVVSGWLSKPTRNHELAISCNTCQRQNNTTLNGDKEGVLPMLVFYMNDSTSSRRHRRSITSVEGGNNYCNLHSQLINFQEIGWDSWLAPITMTVTYCTGWCNPNDSFAGRLITRHTSCCSPAAFRPTTSFLIQGDDGVIRQTYMNNLLPYACRCT